VFDKHKALLDREILDKGIEKAKLPPEEELKVLSLFEQIKEIEVKDDKFHWYLEQLREMAIRRGIAKLIAKYQEKVKLSDRDGTILFNEFVQDLYKTRLELDMVKIKKGFVYDKESIEERIKMYQTRKEKGDIAGIPSGFKELDSKTGGSFPGELVTVFARTSAGKSRLLHNMSYNATEAGFKAIYVTIEMAGDEINRLYDARLCRQYYDKIKKGKLDPQEEDKWLGIMRMMERAKTHKGFYTIDIPSGCTADILEQEVDEYEKQFGKLDLLTVDYLGLMTTTERAKSKTERMGIASQHLKEMARDRRITVLTAAQANRKAAEAEKENEHIGSEHVGFSDEISANSSMMLYIHSNQKKQSTNQMDLSLIKHRDGPKDSMKLYVDWARNYIGDEPWSLDQEMGGRR
jgi:replicative DNA helicase